MIEPHRTLLINLQVFQINSSYSNSQILIVIDLNLTFVQDLATIFHLLLLQVTKLSTKNVQYPEVYFMFIIKRAQSIFM